MTSAGPDTHLRRAESCLREGDLGGAQEALVRAQANAADPVRLLVLRGKVHGAAGQIDRALRAHLEAVRLAPRHVAALAGLAEALVMGGELDKAITCYRRALQQRPDHRGLSAGLAWAEVRLGRASEARARLQPLVDAGGTEPSVLAVWATAGLQLGAVEDALRVLPLALERSGDPEGRATLGHVLGDCLDRAGRSAEAFAAYDLANRAQPVPPYDPAEHTRYVQRLAAVFGGDRGSRLPALGALGDKDVDAPRHVLIVGMPRSGTSLVEQILGQHPGVWTRGELPTLQRLANTLPGRLGATGDAPEVCRDLTPGALLDMRAVYDRHLVGAPPGTRCMTDKMPDNYMWLGLARCFLRGLRVVYCVREPLDTCWSAFTKNFGARVRYTTSLAWLGKRYRDHLTLMDALADGLGDALLRVPYEQLVSEPEDWIRRILAHCELEFAPACLHPEDNPRRVATASYAQVQKPINPGSVGRAGAYAPFLGELRAALGS